MIKDYIKINNYGNNYLIHIMPDSDVVINKSYIFRNFNNLLVNDIFFGTTFSKYYLFYYINKVINKAINNYIYGLIVFKNER
jgi:hypothetical protein